MMRSYWNNPEVYKNKFKNGWYLCGDRASIDEEGYFWFVGRDDDVINTGGHLVGPFEIESALLEHPGGGRVAPPWRSPTRSTWRSSRPSSR